MTKLNSVDAAIQAAEQAARDNNSRNQVVEANHSGSQGGVAHYQAPRTKTIDDLSAGGLNVDAFLKVTEHGLEIKEKKGLIESIVVDIDVASHIQVCDVVKYGNPAQYYKTYDGVTCATGGTWQQALSKAQMADPNARPYQSADLTMTLAEDALDVKGNVVATKGTILGHSTSTTNKGNLKALTDEITKDGLRDAVVRVKLTSEERVNKAGNVWGVIKFELLGEAPPQD